MSYTEQPKPEHRNALTQINDARQRAHTAVSEYRQRRFNTPHPNLAPSSEDGQTLPVMATAAVNDYLLQLRPYRHTSKRWHLDFGTVEIPTEITRPSPRRGEQRRASLWLCRQPEVELQNVSQLIEVLNMDVHYSTNAPVDNSQAMNPRLRPDQLTPEEQRVKDAFGENCKVIARTSYRIDPESYPGKFHVDRQTFEKISRGAISQDEAVEMDMVVDADETGDDPGYTPADPNVSSTAGDTTGTDGKLKTFKFVFGPSKLQRLVEMADDVAEEMDLLIEMQEPDHSSGGSGAV